MTNNTTPPYAHAQALDALARTVPHPTATCSVCDGDGLSTAQRANVAAAREHANTPEFKESIRRSYEDIAAGRVKSWEDVKKEHGWATPTDEEMEKFKRESDAFALCPTCHGTKHRTYTGMAEWLESHGAGWPMLVWANHIVAPSTGHEWELIMRNSEPPNGVTYIPALPYIVGEGVCSVFGFLEEALGVELSFEGHFWGFRLRDGTRLGGYENADATLTAILERVAHETEAKA